MEYKILFEKGNYTLIQRGSRLQEYAVVAGLNKGRGDWAHTCVCHEATAEGLARTLDYFLYRTENIIPRDRLIKLATLFKDGLLEDDEDSAIEYFEDTCGMDEDEIRFFGLESETGSEPKTKFDNPMYNKGYDDGYGDALNELEEEMENK